MSHIPLDEVRPIDLEQQKKRAKELARALANADAGALRRYRALHPKSTALSDAQIVERLAKVTEAQLVIARELGLPSWAKLRRHIERHSAARAEVAAGARVLDGDPPTMHIRCGTDIQQGLQRAGLQGGFLEFNDPYCQGPVPDRDDLVQIRAQFIAAAYHMPIDDIRVDLGHALRELEASRRQDRVVLWFEHDSFDQLILARILAFYAQHGAPRRLELVHIDRFPAVDDFHGLGELSPAALRMLWDDRVVVSPELLALGTRVWDALRQESPVALYETAHASDALPQMGAAVLRHLQELPWVSDGLSLTQRLTLELLRQGPLTAGVLFLRYTNEREPLVHLGDAMYYAVLEDMLQAGFPAIELVGEREQERHKREVALSQTGRRVLNGELDWLTCAPTERWVGGVRIAAGLPVWRWDNGPVLRSQHRVPSSYSSRLLKNLDIGMDLLTGDA